MRILPLALLLSACAKPFSPAPAPLASDPRTGFMACEGIHEVESSRKDAKTTRKECNVSTWEEAVTSYIECAESGAKYCTVLVLSASETVFDVEFSLKRSFANMLREQGEHALASVVMKDPRALMLVSQQEHDIGFVITAYWSREDR